MRRLLVGVAALAIACRQAEPSSAEPAPAPAPEPDATAKADADPPAAAPPEAAPPGEAGADDPPLRKDGTLYASAELMGTRVSLNVWVPPTVAPRDAAAAMEAALDAMVAVDDAMSEWRPDSELSRLSAGAGGKAQVVSTGLFDVLERAKEIAEDTDGAFDPTFHGVGQLWSFKPGATPPSDAAIAEKLPLVGHDKLEIDTKAGSVRLTRPGMKLGLGAIAKGYAVDRASAVLRDRGLADHVVEAGGDTYAAGTKGGKPWMVGIQTPGERGVVGVIPSTNRAVVTSGDYQRYFEYEGKRYAHILDPRTGKPVAADRSPHSVTVVASNATDADAYATAIAVMGTTAGMAFIETREGLDAVVIDNLGQVHISSGLRDVVVAPDGSRKLADVPTPAR